MCSIFPAMTPNCSKGVWGSAWSARITDEPDLKIFLNFIPAEISLTTDTPPGVFFLRQKSEGRAL